MHRAYAAALGVACAWAALNCAYVYLVLEGRRSFRIESAVILLLVLSLPRVLAGTARPALAPSRGRGADVALLGLAGGLWLATFLPLAAYPFLSDDYAFLARYRHLGDVTSAPQFFRPLFALVVLLVERLGGGSPVPFHLLGFGLHLACAALVYVFVRRVPGAGAAAVLASVAFLLSPLQLEAVLWVSGLQELLWTFFALLALCCCVRAEEPSAARTASALVLLACALASKETALGLVLALPVADAARPGRRRGRGLLVRVAAFGLLAVAYLIVRRRCASIDPSFFAWPTPHAVKQFLVLPYERFAQPWNAAAVSVPPLVACLVALAAIGLVFAAVVTRRASAHMFLGPALILCATLPLGGYFFVDADLAAARYLYFPAVGWGLLLAELSAPWLRDRRALVAAGAGLSLFWSVCLHVNLRPWHVAGDVVRRVESAVQRGETIEPALAEWQAVHGVRLTLEGGVPRSYQGVAVFRNGYPEFLERVRARGGAEAR